MKTVAFLLIATGLLSHPLAGHDLPVVHEWGTFTTVSGSDGQPLSWYQPQADLAGLPRFVQHYSPFQKSTPDALLRMETPVIYFYPAKPLPVTVRATFHSGRITEVFPHPVPPFAIPAPSLPEGAKAVVAPSLQPLRPASRVEWQGELIPPNDENAAGTVPKVEPGLGDHYAHARKVPDAWLFRTRETTFPDRTEKFIFYRGAGDVATPVRVGINHEGMLEVRNEHAEPVTHAFVMHVKDGKAGWSKLDALPPASAETLHAAMPPAELSTAAAATQVARAMEDALAEAGLTRSEAAAMVATWRKNWFEESGTRVLCLLPASWVDTILPLEISPKPGELRRVFVARLEVLTPDVEQRLTNLLGRSLSGEPAPALAAEFRALDLGRFGSAAVERSTQLVRRRHQVAFEKLQLEAAKLAQSKGATVSAR